MPSAAAAMTGVLPARVRHPVLPRLFGALNIDTRSIMMVEQKSEWKDTAGDQNVVADPAHPRPACAGLFGRKVRKAKDPCLPRSAN